MKNNQNREESKIFESKEEISQLIQDMKSDFNLNSGLGYQFISKYSETHEYIIQGQINKIAEQIFLERMFVESRICVVWAEDFSGISGFVGATDEDTIFGFSWCWVDVGDAMEKFTKELIGKLSDLLGKEVDLKELRVANDFDLSEITIGNKDIGNIYGYILPDSYILGVLKVRTPGMRSIQSGSC